MTNKELRLPVGREGESLGGGRHESRLMLVEDDGRTILVGKAARAGERHHDHERVDCLDVGREGAREVSHGRGEERAAGDRSPERPSA